jgi:hypothetical protein
MNKKQELNILLADAFSDYIELKWDDYNKEIIKAYRLGKKHAKKHGKN